MKRITAALLTFAALSLTIAATTTPAQARDTTWACPTCVTTHR